MAITKMICNTCSREFNSDGRSECWGCKNLRLAKSDCPYCGKPKLKQSKMCKQCHLGGGHYRGELAPNWKGAPHWLTNGYEMMPDPERPGKAIGVHRQVMREHLGRPFFSGENVHHINGVKTDNRIENLELWVTKQPYGQRPEDLLEWADEIIARYRGVAG